MYLDRFYCDTGPEKYRLENRQPVRKGYNKENLQEILGGASTNSQSLLIVIVKSRMNTSTVSICLFAAFFGRKKF